MLFAGARVEYRDVKVFVAQTRNPLVQFTAFDFVVLPLDTAARTPVTWIIPFPSGGAEGAGGAGDSPRQTVSIINLFEHYDTFFEDMDAVFEATIGVGVPSSQAAARVPGAAAQSRALQHDGGRSSGDDSSLEDGDGPGRVAADMSTVGGGAVGGVQQVDTFATATAHSSSVARRARLMPDGGVDITNEQMMVRVCPTLDDLRRYRLGSFRLSKSLAPLLEHYYSDGYGFIMCHFELPMERPMVVHFAYTVALSPESDDALFVPLLQRGHNKGYSQYDHRVYSINTSRQSGGVSTDERARREYRRLTHLAAKQEPGDRIDVHLAFQHKGSPLQMGRFPVALCEMVELRQLQLRGRRRNEDLFVELDDATGYFFEARRALLGGERERAEELLKRCLQRNENHVAALATLANLLKGDRARVDAADTIFKRLLKANPVRSSSLANTALFLEMAKRNIDTAELLYQRAIKVDPLNVLALTNFAVLLKNHRRDYDYAEALYKRAIQVNPLHVNTIGNYALFLHQVRKQHPKADQLFRLVLELTEGGDEFWRRRYTQFLEELQKSEKLDQLIQCRLPPLMVPEVAEHLRRQKEKRRDAAAAQSNGHRHDDDGNDGAAAPRKPTPLSQQQQTRQQQQQKRDPDFELIDITVGVLFSSEIVPSEANLHKLRQLLSFADVRGYFTQKLAEARARKKVFQSYTCFKVLCELLSLAMRESFESGHYRICKDLMNMSITFALAPNEARRLAGSDPEHSTVPAMYPSVTPAAPPGAAASSADAHSLRSSTPTIDGRIRGREETPLSIRRVQSERSGLWTVQQEIAGELRALWDSKQFWEAAFLASLADELDKVHSAMQQQGEEEDADDANAPEQLAAITHAAAFGQLGSFAINMINVDCDFNFICDFIDKQCLVNAITPDERRRILHTATGLAMAKAMDEKFLLTFDDEPPHRP